MDVVPDRARPLRVLDVGTGSGCILIALLTEFPNATGVGLDIQPGAIEIGPSLARQLRGAGATVGGSPVLVASAVIPTAWAQRAVTPRG